MSLPSLPVQHLSDEAVAAFADGALGSAPRARAARHVAACNECARAVTVQREAVLALRAATAPALPCGLLDRLRAVPSTTPLDQPPVALDPNGSAVFAAFGTPLVEPTEPAAPPSQPAPMTLDRRHRPYGSLITVAAAVVALGTAGIAFANARDAGQNVPGVQAPAGPSQVSPAVFDPSVSLFYQSITDGTRILPTRR